MLIAALLAFLPTVLWGHSTDHYGKVSLVSGGGGTVYLTENSDGATSLGTSKGWNCGESESADSHTYRCYAVPNADYRFVEWSGTGVDDSKKTNNPMVYTGKTRGTKDNPEEFVLTATFVKIERYDITYECSGGSYVAGSRTITSSLTVQESNESSVLFKNPTPNTGYKFAGWYIKHPNGVKEFVSYYKTYEMLYDSSVAVGAEFVADHTVTFEVPADGSMTYKVGDATAVAVEEQNDTVGIPDSSVVTLSAVSFDSNKTPKWYVKDEAGVKSYFAVTPTATRTVTASETIGVDFIAQNTVLVNAIESVKDGGTVTLDGDAEIVYGTTLTIPSGVTVDLGGHTLYVDGTLVNNGAIQNGTISKCAKLIRQTGNGLSPIEADDISYWDTRIENSTATAPESSASHITIVNGYGTVIHGAMANTSPGAIVCTIDNSAGASVNTITGYVSDHAKVGGGSGSAIFAAGKIPKTTDKIVVQLTSSVSLSINTDFPSDSNWQATKNSQPNGKLGYGFRIDCAHNSISVSYEFTTQESTPSTTYFINASSAKRTSGYLLGAIENFINCAEVTQRINNNSDCAAKFNVYDCANPTVSFSSSTKLSAGRGVNFRSGGPYTLPAATDDNYANYNIYGGCYTAVPDNGRNRMSGTHKFYQHADGKWYLELNQDPKAAEVGGQKKLYLSEALQVAAEAGTWTTVTVLRDCNLDTPFVIPAEAKIRIELAGCKINAPNGFIVNNGELDIGDKYGNISASGVDAGNETVFVNEAEGKIEVAYGKYSGGILLKAGSEFITHHGTFNGALSVGDGVADKRSVASLCGGIFTTDVTEYLHEGYRQTSGYVGALPYPSIEDQLVDGYEAGYSVHAMDVDDLALYTGVNTTRDSFSDVTKWFSRAELYSRAAPYLGYTIDAVVKFDRDVAANSITAYGKTVLSFSQKLDLAVAAGAEYRAISGKVASKNYYQISYSRFITDNDVNSLVCALKSDSNDNVGTTCRFNLDLCSGANKYDVSKLKSIYTIGSRSFVFGAGDNAAMLQTAAGAVPDENFFATLEAAVASDATTGKTIKLCNNCNEQVTVTKACTIDLNGFAFSGTLTAGEGLSMNTENGVYVFKAPDSADVYVEQVKVDTVVSDDWKTENGLSENATEEEIHDALKAEDANKLPKWENLVIGQNPDEKAAVTAANGGTETTVDVAVTFEVPKDKTTGEKIETGYTVKYAFDKVDDKGVVVENGEGTAQATPTLNIESVTAEEGPAYFKMRAVLEASDNNGVTAEVPVEKTIGVMKVESASEYTILAVPWVSLGTGDVKASELVHAASLKEGDELIVYGDDGKTFNKWTVMNGEWAKSTEYDLDDDEPQASATPEPSSVGLARGKGVWLKRSKPEESPIYLIGQPSDDAVETLLAVADDTEGSSWNLVASPSAEPVDVAALLGAKGDNADKEDRVVVPTGANSAPKNFHYRVRKGVGAWGYDSTEYVLDDNDNVLGVRAVFVTTGDGTTVPAGTGFWYLNSSKDATKTISWGGTDNNQVAE